MLNKRTLFLMLAILLGMSGCGAGDKEQHVIKFSLNNTVIENTSIKQGVEAKIFRNKNNQIYGFEINGTTNYAEDGYDIIAAGISMVVLNTINSLDKLSKDKFEDELSDGYARCIVMNLKKGQGTKESEVLLESLKIGLESIEDSYGSEYLKVIEIMDK